MAQICLISPLHVSFHPRILREAESLHELGYDVRVVCRHTDTMLTDRDYNLMQTRKWRLQPVDLRRHGPQHCAWLIEGIRSKVYEHIFEAGLHTVRVAIRGYVRGLSRLTALAVAEPADWFIAHTHAALPVAAAAAKRWKARLGFDCEDLLSEAGTDPADIVRLIERTYLPLCDYVSVPSYCIGGRLLQDYGIDFPLVLYNVFPLHLAKNMLPPRQRPRKSVVRLHWFGQTIGLDRGIEDAVEALGLINKNVELHMRGRVTQRSCSTILDIARKYNVAEKIVFHAPIDHDDLIKSMDQFDIGLALERPEHGNYSKTVTNKVFAYLLAGLAVAATDTPGQREVMKQIPSVGFLYPAGNPGALADGLRGWIKDHNALRTAQQVAWDVARTKFCWDLEKEKFLLTLHRPPMGKMNIPLTN